MSINQSIYMEAKYIYIYTGSYIRKDICKCKYMCACTIILGCLNVGLNCTLLYEYACLYVCMPNIYFNLELDQTTLCVPVIDFANAPNLAKFSLHWSTSLIFILHLVQFDFVLVLNVAKEEWEVIVLQTLNGLFVDIRSKETKGHVHYVTEIL